MAKDELVMIESPYRNGDRARNLRYLAWCEYHSAEVLGEFPISSHGNCTAYWPEDDEHRVKGFAWRQAVALRCDRIAYYSDFPISEGMRVAFERDQMASQALGMVQFTNTRRAWPLVESRRLPIELFERFERDEYPPGSMRRAAGWELKWLQEIHAAAATPWPLVQILSTLVAATTHLLEDHNCDVHGYERFGLARAAAKRILENV